MAESPVVVQDAGGAVRIGFRRPSMLDATTVEAVAHELYAVTERSRRRGIVLDFTDVHFVSSPALSMLLTLRRKADDVGSEVVLCGLRAHIRRLFQITRLDKLFLIFDSPAAAAARFAPPAGSSETRT